MQQKRSTPTPTPPPRKKPKPQPSQQQFQQQQYNQQQQQQQDVGLARLGALSALADLGQDGQDILNEASTINYEDLNLGFQGGSGSKQGQRWLNRASELLDLSSGDSREGSHEDVFQAQNQGQGQAGLIPQIVMNPWDPSQAPMMTFAVQAYQHQWLLQQQQNMSHDNEEASITHEMEEESFKPRVVCIPPDEEMGFLLNLPPPCNVILQPSTIGLSGKVPESPFMQAYQKFLRGETPIKPAAPVEPPPPDSLPGKKKYIPPYTPHNPNRPKSSVTNFSRQSSGSSSSNNR